MGKVAGAASLAFMMGGGAMSVFTDFLGGYAEAAALGLVGFTLVAMSQVLGSKWVATGESTQTVFSKAS